MLKHRCYSVDTKALGPCRKKAAIKGVFLLTPKDNGGKASLPQHGIIIFLA